jgi:hypothetical protein
MQHEHIFCFSFVYGHIRNSTIPREQTVAADVVTGTLYSQGNMFMFVLSTSWLQLASLLHYVYIASLVSNFSNIFQHSSTHWWSYAEGSLYDAEKYIWAQEQGNNRIVKIT